jgi:putative ABC transport system ATP-binding protein
LRTGRRLAYFVAVSDAVPLLRFEGLVKRYRADRPPVLDGLSLTLCAGDYVAITGESGVGKSTLLNLLAGLDRPDAGRIRYDGVDFGTLDDDAATLFRRRHIGFVFQAFHVLPYLTAVQNVELPLQLLGVAARERRARAGKMLAAVGLSGFAERYPRELSGGELQRIAIARAVVHTPRLVLADEPTGNLDPRTAGSVLALLREQVLASGGAGILITHSRTVAASAGRVLVLDGRSLRAADPAEVT